MIGQKPRIGEGIFCLVRQGYVLVVETIKEEKKKVVLSVRTDAYKTPETSVVIGQKPRLSEGVFFFREATEEAADSLRESIEVPKEIIVQKFPSAVELFGAKTEEPAEGDEVDLRDIVFDEKNNPFMQNAKACVAAGGSLRCVLSNAVDEKEALAVPKLELTLHKIDGTRETGVTCPQDYVVPCADK